jgi:hypothetical protein
MSSCDSWRWFRSSRILCPSRLKNRSESATPSICGAIHQKYHQQIVGFKQEIE